MMQVVLLDFAQRFGDAQAQMVQLARGLTAHEGVTPVLACFRSGVLGQRLLHSGVSEAHGAESDVDVQPLLFRGSYGHFLWLFKLLPVLRRGDAVLHAHGLQAALGALWCARFVRNLPIVVTFRGTWLLRRLPLMVRRQVRAVCARANAVCVPTEELAEVLVGLGAPRDAVCVCLPAVSAVSGLSDAETGRTVFLAADELVQGGGLSDLVDAMALVQGMEDMPPWEVRINGEGEEFEALLDKARSLRVDARLALLGPQSVEEQLRLCDVAVSVARESRGQFMFVLRAWACGRPLLCSGTLEMRALLEDKINALVFPPGNAVALGAAMVRCLQDREWRARLAEGGRATVQEYSPARTVATMAALYARKMTAKEKIGVVS